MSDEDRPVLFSYGGADGGPRVEVTVSEDAMLAWGTFYSGSEPQGKLLIWTEFVAALQSSGLGSGLLERELQEALFRYNTGHHAPEKIVLARGLAPVEERPAYLRLEARFFSHHFQEQHGPQIDFKEYSPFVIVKKGELLARGILPRPGAPGKNVLGVDLPAGKKDIKHLRPGPHTIYAHGKVFSRIAGRFTVEGDVFDVSDTLELDAGVGYGTGNLVFPGSVVVKGVVSDGFRLVAGQSLTVKGPLDASEVLSHGNLVVEGGIIGKKPGIVRSGGTIKALFVEHCQVEALGTIWVTKALLHATVNTNSDLQIDDNGRIVASTVWVKGNLTCGQLGGDSGPVRVVAGSDFVVRRKLDALRVKYQGVEGEIQKDKARHLDPNPEHVAAMAQIVSEMNELTPRLFANPSTEVRVSGKIFEGTVIDIGFASLTIVREVKGQLFKLAPDGKSILAVPLSKAEKDSGPVPE